MGMDIIGTSATSEAGQAETDFATAVAVVKGMGLLEFNVRFVQLLAIEWWHCKNPECEPDDID